MFSKRQRNNVDKDCFILFIFKMVVLKKSVLKVLCSLWRSLWRSTFKDVIVTFT